MDKINQLIKLSIEIEGILRVIESRGDQDVAFEEEMLQDKYAQFGDLLYNQSVPEVDAQEPETEDEPAEDLSDEVVEEPSVDVDDVDEAEPQEETEIEAPQEEYNEPIALDEDIDEEPVEKLVEEPVAETIEEEPAEESQLEEEPLEQSIHGIDEDEVVETPEPETEVEPEVVPVAEAEVEPEEIVSVDEAEDAEETVVELRHADPEQLKRFDEDGIADDLGVIRVDEMLARQGSKDLRKAFTLNDKFRFRRELFGNSDSEMSDAIDMVSAMLTYDEATDYFYNDLGWDATDEHVKDFMAVIANHFETK